MLKQHFLLLWMGFFLSALNGHCQDTDITSNSPDSLKYWKINEELNGCWRSKYYQFRYDSCNYRGREYKSQVHSSAPYFYLVLKSGSVYLAWQELTGGEHLQEVIAVEKRRLIVKNEKGLKVVYKRNKECIE